MKVAEVLARRRHQWLELDRLCQLLETRRASKIDAESITTFTRLYRAACADLALADAYQLPPTTVQYLHRLVGRAHNQLYRTRRFDYGSWTKTLLVDVPQRIFLDGCVKTAFLIFWGVFLLSALLASSANRWPEYAEQILGEEQIERLETDFARPIGGRDAGVNPVMASFYIYHNTGIGLKCFATGLLVIPGLLTTTFNAAVLGAAFGYMARSNVAAGANFYHFVTAHGPFELTAIVLSAGAGLRLGLAWMNSQGLARTTSLTRNARDAMPIMAAAMILFCLAALIEAFLSPSAAPYTLKAIVALISSGLLMFYFVVLGYPRR